MRARVKLINELLAITDRRPEPKITSDTTASLMAGVANLQSSYNNIHWLRQANAP